EGSGAPPAGTADRTLGMQANAPMRSRPPDRSVRVEGPAHGRQISKRAPLLRASHTRGQTARRSARPRHRPISVTPPEDDGGMLDQLAQTITEIDVEALAAD